MKTAWGRIQRGGTTFKSHLQNSTGLYWSSSELAELEGTLLLGDVKKVRLMSLSKVSAANRAAAARLFGHDAQGFGVVNVSTVLLNLVHRMATLIMTFGLIVRMSGFLVACFGTNLEPRDTSGDFTL